MKTRGAERELDRIRVCASGKRLDFVFFASWLGGRPQLTHRLAR